MTYYDVINELLNRISTTINHLINIVVSRYNANYKDISIVCLDYQNYINFRSLDYLTKFTADGSAKALENHLESFKFITTTKDKRY